MHKINAEKRLLTSIEQFKLEATLVKMEDCPASKDDCPSWLWHDLESCFCYMVELNENLTYRRCPCLWKLLSETDVDFTVCSYVKKQNKEENDGQE